MISKIKQWLYGEDEMGDNEAIDCATRAVKDAELSELRFELAGQFISKYQGSNDLKEVVLWIGGNGDACAIRTMIAALKACPSSRQQSQSRPSQDSQSENPETEQVATD